MEVVEESIKLCDKCNKKTKFARNSTQEGGLGLIMHLILTIVTFGVWLLFMLFILPLYYFLKGVKRNEWICTICGSSYKS